MASWGMARAKAQLSEVVHEAVTTGPQTLSRSGRDVAVVISIEEWRKLKEAHAPAKPIMSVAELVLNSPFHGLERPRLVLRDRTFE